MKHLENTKILKTINKCLQTTKYRARAQKILKIGNGVITAEGSRDSELKITYSKTGPTIDLTSIVEEKFTKKGGHQINELFKSSLKESNLVPVNRDLYIDTLELMSKKGPVETLEMIAKKVYRFKKYFEVSTETATA